MTTTVYDIGDKPTFVATFKDSTGTLADPTAIDFEVLAPDGTSTTGTIVDASNPSTGVYHYVLPDLDQEGWWYVRAAGTSGVVAAVEQKFRVRASQFD